MGRGGIDKSIILGNDQADAGPLESGLASDELLIFFDSLFPYPGNYYIISIHYERCIAMLRQPNCQSVIFTYFNQYCRFLLHILIKNHYEILLVAISCIDLGFKSVIAY